MIEEFPRPRRRQDPSLPPQSALFQVLRAACRAARSATPEEARAYLEAASGIDATATVGLAARMRQLPAWSTPSVERGIEIARDGFADATSGGKGIAMGAREAVRLSGPGRAP
jgi:hypothetical protein